MGQERSATPEGLPAQQNVSCVTSPKALVNDGF